MALPEFVHRALAGLCMRTPHQTRRQHGNDADDADDADYASRHYADDVMMVGIIATHITTSNERAISKHAHCESGHNVGTGAGPGLQGEKP